MGEEGRCRCRQPGIGPSVVSVGDSYGNALAEAINGLDKAESIRRRGPWRSFEAVGVATLTGSGRFNNRQLMKRFGNFPLAEGEERHYTMQEEPGMTPQLKPFGFQ